MDKIEHHDHIEYERQLQNNDKQELYLNNKLHILKVHMCVMQYINRSLSYPIYSF